jgi:hypothetical protein
MKHQTVNATIVSKYLAICKRTTIIYFILMVLLVIIIDPINMTKTVYKYYDIEDDDITVIVSLINIQKKAKQFI